MECSILDSLEELARFGQHSQPEGNEQQSRSFDVVKRRALCIVCAMQAAKCKM